MSKRYKNRLPPFVPLLASTLDAPAWKAMSHGARSLYVALKRRVPNERNRAYLSYREAARDIGAGKTQVSVWFAELQHYGFIVLLQPGCLGVDGKGKAPHWRLTEKGETSKASAGGLFDPPTNDFLKWDGTKFRIPSRRGDSVSRRGRQAGPVVRDRDRPKCPVVRDIQQTASVPSWRT